MNLAPTFDVFLCHNSEDKPIVKNIGKKLKKEGLKPWLDEWELQPGMPWQVSVEEQIHEIRSAAVFVGKMGIGPWVYRVGLGSESCAPLLWRMHYERISELIC